MTYTRQIVLDTETTGLDPKLGHKLIEIGCIEITGRRIHPMTFHRFINPQRRIEQAALEVHGITDKFLADKPVFTDIIPDLLDYIKNAQLIIHNAAFDLSFLNCELGEIHGPVERYCSIFDTLALARQLHPGQKNSLDALCKRYNIDNSKRERHGALLDAELLARIYLAMTGGQVSLFANEITKTTLQQQDAMFSQKTEWIPLPIILANPQEIAEHQAYLANISKLGHCLWQKLEDKNA